MLLANSARRNHKPNQKSENRAEKKPPNRKVCTKCYTSLSILHIVAVSFWTAVVVPKFGNELETRVRGMNNLAKTKKRSSQREEWRPKSRGKPSKGKNVFCNNFAWFTKFQGVSFGPFSFFFSLLGVYCIFNYFRRNNLDSWHRPPASPSPESNCESFGHIISTFSLHNGCFSSVFFFWSILAVFFCALHFHQRQNVRHFLLWFFHFIILLSREYLSVVDLYIGKESCWRIECLSNYAYIYNNLICTSYF